MKQPVIFTDLDGTLLDHETYSFGPALPALKLIRELDIPLIVCSSKTRKEIEWYRDKLGNTHPFISENGGGIFIPSGYFDTLGQFLRSAETLEDGYVMIRLGAPYRELRSALLELRNEGFGITGFGDMTTAEVAAVTGLPEEQAAMSRERDFDEPFLFNGDDTVAVKLQEAIRLKGFNLTQGRFFHILGGSDKGKAAAILADLYRKNYGEITTCALGDSPNDLPMLEYVDYPVIVKKSDGRHDPRIDIPRLIKAEGAGPIGWNLAIIGLLDDWRRDC
ncbi:MAG: HAD-IIB family hydrolase [Geobacteraceae bacterium]|nr:HAD-IIB family hydrolase [Geobacteraceae bacterium]